MNRLSLSILMLQGIVGSWLAAWNWIEPHNFLSAILFLLVWGFTGKILVAVFTFLFIDSASLMG